MDMNETLSQLANNPQMLAQLMSMIQQNGMNVPNQQQQRQPMNWNMPTNPMAAVWWNNMMNSMNNQNAQNNSQQTPNQNQNIQSQTSQQPKTNNTVSSVRVINSPDEIKPDEIPMNGSISLFLQDDLKVVYGKRWTNTGKIDDMIFVLNRVEDQNDLEIPSNNTPNTEALIEEISKMIDGKLEEFKETYHLDKNSSNKQDNYNKKEGNGNGK